VVVGEVLEEGDVLVITELVGAVRKFDWVEMSTPLVLAVEAEEELVDVVVQDSQIVQVDFH